MPSVARLKRRREFLRVAATRRKWVAPGLIVQVADAEPEAGAEAVRVGFTVTRKVGNAVVRNRVRRRLKEAARLVLPLHARTGRDYVIIGREGTLRRSFSDLVGDLLTALRRLGCHVTDRATAAAIRERDLLLDEAAGQEAEA